LKEGATDSAGAGQEGEVEVGVHVESSGVAASERTFDGIYRDHFDAVWRAARRLGVPEANAEDAVQDAFVVLHRKLGEYDGRTTMRRFLLGIVTKVASDYRRRYRRKDSRAVELSTRDDGEERFASTLPTPNETAEERERTRLIEALLSELDDDKREVLVLTEFEELTAPEIAELLGVNVNTISSRLRAARRAFELAYEKHRTQAEGRTS